METLPKAQQIYRHFKGKLYQIVTLAEHTETGEMLVIYQALYDEFKVYARPLSMFTEKVDMNKYPDARQEYRFELWNSGNTNEDAGTVKAAEKDNKAVTEKVLGTDCLRGSESCADSTVESVSEETGIDPMVLEFLDASSCEERLNILAALHHRITDDMINTMAVAIDVEVEEGELEERYAALHKSLLLFDKFECGRFR